MGQSHHRVWIHMVWSTKYRAQNLEASWRPKLFDEFFRIAKKHGIILDTVNGVSDHVHVLVRLKPSQSFSEIARLLKGASSRWINKLELSEEVFYWQIGYGVLSVSPDRIEVVRNYIRNQEKHHQETSFKEEMENFEFYEDE